MENNCPLCNRECFQSVNTKSKVQDTDNFITSIWLLCCCGAVWNNEPYDTKVFNTEYTKGYAEAKNAKERYDYYIRVYVPLIEELTYGRKMLDVGYGVDWNILAMRERGWLATGIDLIPNDKYHTGDFLSFDFGKERFDLIKMTDVLSMFHDPGQAIKVAYDLLYPTGILWLTFPDTDLLKTGTLASWGHWNAKEHKVHINEAILRDIFTKCDDLTGRMNIKVIHRNISKRFVSWNVCNVIAQKEKREIAQ